MRQPRRPPSREIRQRNEEIIELRRAGESYGRIADHYGLSKARVCDIIRQACDLSNAPNINELRAAEGDRLDRLQQKVWAKALDGDIPAIRTVLAIMDRRARLFGLDAPVRVDIQQLPADVASLTERVRALRVAQAEALEQPIVDAEVVEAQEA